MITGFSILLMAVAPLHEAYADIDQLQKDNQEVWTTGVASQESTETSLASSMIWWGVGLTVGIAILIAFLHGTSTSSAHQ